MEIERLEILRKIEAGEVSPEEGLRLLNAVDGDAPETPERMEINPHFRSCSGSFTTSAIWPECSSKIRHARFFQIPYPLVDHVWRFPHPYADIRQLDDSGLADEKLWLGFLVVLDSIRGWHPWHGDQP